MIIKIIITITIIIGPNNINNNDITNNNDNKLS